MKKWRKRTLFGLAPVLIAVLIILYFLFLTPSANSLILPDVQYGQNYNPAAYKAVDAQVTKDIGYQDSIAGFVRKNGNFYDFGISPADNSGGGIELIAYMNQSGHFEKVWDGQDAPDCYSIDKYKVPVDIAPWCDATIQIDRSNPVRSFFSLFGW